MSNQQRLLRALAALLPGGAFGASVLLALTSNTGEARSSQAVDRTSPPSVAERLTAIRAAVSNITPNVVAESPQPTGSAEFGPGEGAHAQPTWWGNGGWGRWGFGWGNHGLGWPNWHNGGWGNGGWHNGGWGNGGWHNGGWGNGGWHNYWHNY
jgi:hypothetical protein